MGRAPCCEKVGLKKGPWTHEEDQILINYIQRNGHGNWRKLPKQAGLLRCGKSCRLRWINYLRPDIKRGNFSQEEEDTIIRLHQSLGNRWSAIAAKLPGRTDNEIKNVWHTHLKKKLVEQHDNNKNVSSSCIEAKSKSRDEETKVMSSDNTIPESPSSDDNNNSLNVTDYEENNSSFDEIKDEDFWSEVLSEDNYSIGFAGLEFLPILSPPLLPASTEMEYNWLVEEQDNNETTDHYCFGLFTKAAYELCYLSNNF